ncbi:MFS transporter, partial [bacterium]|nr:MFS transporter [bacterium]
VGQHRADRLHREVVVERRCGDDDGPPSGDAERQRGVVGHPEDLRFGPAELPEQVEMPPDVTPAAHRRPPAHVEHPQEHSTQHGGRPEGRWWLTGWRQIRSDPAVTQAAIELTLISTALIIISGLIPKYIEDVLGLPVDVGAIVLSPAAVGIILGLRIANFLSHRVPHAVLSTTGFIGFVILLALVAFVREEASFLGGYGAFAFLNDVSVGQFDGAGVLAIILVMPLGFSYALVSVAGSTVLNDRVPLHLQGRVLSTQAALSALASSLPVLAAGALGDLIGVTPVMAIVAGVIGAIAALNMRPRADSPAPIRSTL